MKAIHKLLLSLFFAAATGCAATHGTWFTVNKPSAEWEQLPRTIPSDDPQHDLALVMTLLHRGTGATVRIERWYLGLRSVTDISRELQHQLRLAGIFVSRPHFDGCTAVFETSIFDRRGALWRGRVAVFRLDEDRKEAPTFIFYGKWPAEYDRQMSGDFEEMVHSASM